MLPEEDEGTKGEEGDPTVEVFLGEFHVSVFQPLSNTTVRIDFKLYGTVLAEKQTVYDELVCEVDEDFGFTEELSAIMSQSPGEWADGWPIKVSAWSGKRYKK